MLIAGLTLATLDEKGSTAPARAYPNGGWALHKRDLERSLARTASVHRFVLLGKSNFPLRQNLMIAESTTPNFLSPIANPWQTPTEICFWREMSVIWRVASTPQYKTLRNIYQGIDNLPSSAAPQT